MPRLNIDALKETRQVLKEILKPTSKITQLPSRADFKWEKVSLPPRTAEDIAEERMTELRLNGELRGNHNYDQPAKSNRTT